MDDLTPGSLEWALEVRAREHSEFPFINRPKYPIPRIVFDVDEDALIPTPPSSSRVTTNAEDGRHYQWQPQPRPVEKSAGGNNNVLKLGQQDQKVATTLEKSRHLVRRRARHARQYIKEHQSRRDVEITRPAKSRNASARQCKDVKNPYASVSGKIHMWTRDVLRTWLETRGNHWEYPAGHALSESSNGSSSQEDLNLQSFEAAECYRLAGSGSPQVQDWGDLQDQPLDAEDIQFGQGLQQYLLLLEHEDKTNPPAVHSVVEQEHGPRDRRMQIQHLLN